MNDPYKRGYGGSRATTDEGAMIKQEVVAGDAEQQPSLREDQHPRSYIAELVPYSVGAGIVIVTAAELIGVLTNSLIGSTAHVDLFAPLLIMASLSVVAARKARSFLAWFRQGWRLLASLWRD